MSVNGNACVCIQPTCRCLAWCFPPVVGRLWASSLTVKTVFKGDFLHSFGIKTTECTFCGSILLLQLYLNSCFKPLRTTARQAGQTTQSVADSSPSTSNCPCALEQKAEGTTNHSFPGGAAQTDRHRGTPYGNENALMMLDWTHFDVGLSWAIKRMHMIASWPSQTPRQLDSAVLEGNDKPPTALSRQTLCVPSGPGVSVELVTWLVHTRKWKWWKCRMLAS